MFYTVIMRYRFGTTEIKKSSRIVYVIKSMRNVSRGAPLCIKVQRNFPSRQALVSTLNRVDSW